MFYSIQSKIFWFCCYCKYYYLKILLFADMWKYSFLLILDPVTLLDSVIN